MSMVRLTVSLAALSLVAFGGAGCSSSPAPSTEAVSTGADAAIESVTAPCSIHSGYPGDDLCLLPPDPKVGFQFHFGPAHYDDAQEVAKYLLMPGEEKTECVLFPSVNTEMAYFQEYHSRLRPGSHHLLNYVQPAANGAAPRTSTAPEACNQTTTFRNLFGATTEKMDVVRAAPGPENDGMAVQLGPKSQVVMQLHVINATSKPILREAWANFRYADKASITELADPIQFIAGVLMSIPVGQTVINKGTATVPANAGPDFRLVAAIPHVHAHTSKVTAWMTRGGKRELLLEQFGKLDYVTEPDYVNFGSETQNPAPNEATQTGGAYSGIVHLAPGDTIDWECVQTNDGIGANGQTFTTPLQFTEQAYTGEMCNIFGLYGPTTGDSWNGFGP